MTSIAPGAEQGENLDALKEVVSRTLEAKGVLGTIRAQLRAAVFTALDEQERQSGIHLENTRAQGIHRNAEGRLLALLLREYLEFYDLDYTLSVFTPEAGLGSGQGAEYAGRESLAGQLGFDTGNQRPLLHELLVRQLQASGVSAGAAVPVSAPPPPVPTSGMIAAVSPSRKSKESKEVPLESKGPETPELDDPPSPSVLRPVQSTGDLPGLREKSPLGRPGAPSLRVSPIIRSGGNAGSAPDLDDDHDIRDESGPSTSPTNRRAAAALSPTARGSPAAASARSSSASFGSLSPTSTSSLDGGGKPTNKLASGPPLGGLLGRTLGGPGTLSKKLPLPPLGGGGLMRRSPLPSTESPTRAAELSPDALRASHDSALGTSSDERRLKEVEQDIREMELNDSSGMLQHINQGSEPEPDADNSTKDVVKETGTVPHGLDGGNAVFGGGDGGEDDYDGDDFEDEDVTSHGDELEISEEVLSVGGSQSFEESTDYFGGSPRDTSKFDRSAGSRISGGSIGGGLRASESVSLSVSVLDSVDHSVDSHALDEYDFVESVAPVKQ